MNIKESLKNLQILVGQKEEKKPNQTKIYNIKAFTQNINKCKAYISNLKTEQIPALLEQQYGLKIDSGLSQASYELQSFTNKLLSPISQNETEISLKNLQKSVENLDEILNILVLEFKELQKKSRKIFSFSQGKKIKVKNQIKEILAIKESLELKIENDARVLSDLIIQKITDIFIIYSALSILANKNKHNFFILEIANSIDRIINVIRPSYSNRSLKSKDMIFYYSIYELKELKNRICPITNVA